MIPPPPSKYLEREFLIRLIREFIKSTKWFLSGILVVKLSRE